MTFFSRVRDVARRAATRRSGPWPRLEEAIDFSALRQAFRDGLAALEREPDSPPPAPLPGMPEWKPPSNASRAASIASEWTGEKLMNAATWLAAHTFSEELAKDSRSVMRLLEATMLQLAGGRAASTYLSTLERVELEHLWRNISVAQSPWQDPLLYAERLGLTVRGELQARGRVLLRLADRDAVEWLLTLEMLDSIGAQDPWRLSRDTARYLFENQKPEFHPAFSEPSFSWEVITRLSDLGVVKPWEDDATGDYGYMLTQLGQSVLSAVLDDRNRMWSVAQTLSRSGIDFALADEPRGHRFGSAGPLARMVTHELRNALFPAGGALDRIRRTIAGDPIETSLAQHVEALASDIGRIDQFAQWLEQISTELGDPPEPFHVKPALEEACRLANGGTIELQLEIDQGLTVTGVRHELVIAWVNLLRNARQHATSKVVLRAESRDQRLHVYVDDDGPGVPEADVARIFQPGVSTRSGGRGWGLSQAKEIVESHRGSIGVSRSVLGGARFSIALPI